MSGKSLPRISVAVPVYNEAALLRGTLQTLHNQTFASIEVLIFDNASTDDTPEVAAEFVRSDSRFHYIRQSHNKGVLQNFYESLLAARGQYFLWRAADDRSDDNFLEELCALLDADPSKSLAVGTVISTDLDRAYERKFEFPLSADPESLVGTITMMYRSHASWIYGLFRTEALVERMTAVMQSYGHPWGFDHLVLLPFLMDNAVAGTKNARFTQIIKRRKAQPSGAKRKKADLSTMLDLRKRFLTQAKEDLRRRNYKFFKSAILNALMWFYTGKRVYKFRTVLRRSLFNRGA